LATVEIENKLKHLPAKPGAYLMKNERGEVIYVGKAASLRSRVRSYFQKGQVHAPKVVAMLAHVRDVDWLVTDSEVEALMLECNLIKRYRPHYNVRLRDDKHYPYLCVTLSEPFPRVLVVRRVKKDGNRYYGPFADSSALRESLRVIRKVFRIRSCNKKLIGGESDRPCLNLHLGQCNAPCAGKIGAEEYGRLVEDAMLFLEGHQESVLSRFHEEMERAADELDFEHAARVRDQIEAVKKIAEKQKMISVEETDEDVISIVDLNGLISAQVLSVRAGKLTGDEHFFLDGAADESGEAIVGEFIKQYYRDAAYIPRQVLLSHQPPETAVMEEWLSGKRGTRVHLTCPQRGEKRHLVEMAAENARLTAERRHEHESHDEDMGVAACEALGAILDMEVRPSRIEAYDISNTQGTEAVGSMVVFVDGLPAKSEYRRFKIKTIDQPDDYGMMREVLRRRLMAATNGDPKFETLPDLMLIDGGKGQLNVAVEVRAEMGYEIPLASLAKRLEEIYTPRSAKPILLGRESEALRLLQRIRDEAHRFAITFHRNLRDKASRKSLLDDIPGVGDFRRKALVHKFGSVVGIRRATVEEIASVSGINQALAQTIYDYLNGI
jgi:excinuclease ABC subunit C